MSDRIKLAEAMFPNKEIRVHSQGIVGFDLPNGTFHNFNPFTDANDDYAVLEWMREDSERLAKFIRVGGTASNWWAYEIGDYARACLKVLEDE